MKRELAVVIMAAGKGTRMNNPDMAKVMYTVASRPMIDFVIDLAAGLGAAKIIAVVGWRKEGVTRHINRIYPSVICVEQTPQLGTGHAVMQAEPALAGFTGDILVLSGDVPLLSWKTARDLIEHHRSTGEAATILSAILPDATGYGRILRDGSGRVQGIIEHRDASPVQREIREINSGIYVFDRAPLFAALREITPTNVQKEYYLTDVFAYFVRNKLVFHAVPIDDPREIQGVNTPAQLEEVRKVIAHRR